MLSIDVSEFLVTGESSTLNVKEWKAEWGALDPFEAPSVRGALTDPIVLPAAREVFLDDTPILLTRTEFDLLDALSARPGVVLGRRQLLEMVRDDPWFGDDHLIDVHIGHLRRKLGEDASRPRYIITVRGVGYRIGNGR